MNISMKPQLFFGQRCCYRWLLFSGLAPDNNKELMDLFTINKQMIRIDHKETMQISKYLLEQQYYTVFTGATLG